MNESKITVRYAKAFFSLAKDAGMIGPWHQDIEKVYQLCNQSEDFLLLLKNPVIKTSQKRKILREILEPHIHAETLRFLLLITSKNREMEIPGICRNFIDRVREERGIVPATVTTAGTLKPGILEEIRLNLERETGKIVELTHKVNPAILGGMVLRVGDKQFDGSISTQLKKMKTTLLAK